MPRGHYEFRPDRTESGILNKLYLTKKQRLSALKWVLLSALIVALSVIQDVIMSRVRIFGGTTDLVSCAILLLGILLEPDQGCVFGLLASAFYYFSGSAPGPQVLILLTGIGSLFGIFSRSYLRSGFLATFLCAAAAVMLYELTIFALSIFLGYTTVARFGVFLASGLLSAAVIPLIYPIAKSIVKIGGNTWKE
ncbi:MAG: hypothetical protein ACI4PO_07620 [Faecousia sp.]